jgi:DNA-binding CsgD family transcriptional regulator
MLYIRTEAVRALLKLVAEAREIAVVGECPRTYVLGELSRLAGAVVAVSFAAEHLSTTPQVTEWIDHGWTTPDRERALEYYRTRPLAHDPLFRALHRAPRRERFCTIRRSDVLGNRTWYSSALHHELHSSARLDDALLSFRFSSDALHGLVFKRAVRDPPFSEDDREVLHLFRCECDWIFEEAITRPRHPAPGLTPREQELLGLLLTGASEKGMAAQLTISPHTVHDHVKRLYRKFGVTSRAELMARAADPLSAKRLGG